MAADGRFVYGIHKPRYAVPNFRQNDHIVPLGQSADGGREENRRNFPVADVNVPEADWVYEIANPFPFRGVTYITKRWADKAARTPESIGLAPLPEVSFLKTMGDNYGGEQAGQMLSLLPESLQLALAVTSSDPADLCRLAEISCALIFDETSRRPTGLQFQKRESASPVPVIYNPGLFEAVANNPFLPADYKEVMVLRPGVQGGSEIVGEWPENHDKTHVFEYLRQNSYIPWGHYAANMAHDAVRYCLSDLTPADITGMRGLYYQRTYVRLARMLGKKVPCRRRPLSGSELEGLRKAVTAALDHPDTAEKIFFDATIWGWNFGFDYAPSHYRLHASHQQVHQQYALSPAGVTTPEGTIIPAFSGGDLLAAFLDDYYRQTGRPFFSAYLEAISGNRRMDERQGERSLVVYEDAQVLLFVPKAQTSQWELQLMTRQPVGNILEAGPEVRSAIDYGIYTAVRVLGALGARMITTFEYSKRITRRDPDHRLLYVFLPKIPHSPGSFSEAQLRWINGHYPEDFAAACRRNLPA